MLTEEQVKNNKERFIALIRSITREGADIDALVNKLESSDFFTAPASTIYHSAYNGGLCAHSLNVYDNLCNLINMKFPQDCPYTSDNIVITALLHDISKMNFYEVAERNSKDENGNWIKVPYIKVRDNEDRFLYCTHELNSLYMVKAFIPLTLEEEVAIANHHCNTNNGNINSDQSAIMNRYSLLTLLHTADILATFVDEAK